MTILFYGSQLSDFQAHLNAAETTASGWFDPDWTPFGVSITNDTPLLTPTFDGSGDVWVHATVAIQQGWDGRRWFHVYNTAGAEVLKIGGTGLGSTTMGVYLSVGGTSTFVTIGSFVQTFSTTHQFDILISRASGRIAVFLDRNTVVSWTGDLSAMAPVSYVGFSQPRDGTNATVISQVIVADTPTLYHNLALVLPSSDGSETGLTGSYADVDEVGPDTTTYLTGDAGGLTSTFPLPATAVTTGKVKAVSVTNFSLKGSEGPTQAANVLRVGGTDYAADPRDLDLGFLPYRDDWEINPATGTGWTIADLTAGTLEFGVSTVD